MSKKTKLSLLATGAVLVLVLALGATAVFAQSDGDDPVPDAETPTVPDDSGDESQFDGQRGAPHHFGLPEGLTAKDELLANALGIDVDTLEAAEENARAAAIDQALAEGLITEEQAEMMLEGGFGHDFYHGRGHHGFGSSIDQEALLADALDISVEELQAAQQEAHEAALAEMVAAGYLTEEEVELMAASQALKEAIDRKALMAEVLGISETELEEALTSRDALATLIEDSGLTLAEFNEAMQAAHEAAVAQAIEDGVITAEQYDALQTLQSVGPRPGGHHRGGHGFGESGGFGGRGFQQQPSIDQVPTGGSSI